MPYSPVGSSPACDFHKTRAVKRVRPKATENFSPEAGEASDVEMNMPSAGCFSQLQHPSSSFFSLPSSNGQFLIPDTELGMGRLAQKKNHGVGINQTRILDQTPREDFKYVEFPLILFPFCPQLRFDIALFLCSIPTHLPQASGPTLNFDLLTQCCPGWSSLGGGEHRSLPVTSCLKTATPGPP